MACLLAKLVLSLAIANVEGVDGPPGQREQQCAADAEEQLGMKIENCHFERTARWHALAVVCVCVVVF